MLRQAAWPPQSPGLNPMEMVWDVMDQSVMNPALEDSGVREQWGLLLLLLLLCGGCVVYCSVHICM